MSRPLLPAEQTTSTFAAAAAAIASRTRVVGLVAAEAQVDDRAPFAAA